MCLPVPSSKEQTVVYSSRHRGISDVFIQYLTYYCPMIVDRSQKIQSFSLHLLQAGATQKTMFRKQLSCTYRGTTMVMECVNYNF